VCFQRADEPVLKSIVGAQLALLKAEEEHFYVAVPGQEKEEVKASELSSAEEVLVASVVLRAVKVGLFGPARHLCQRLQGRLSPQSEKFVVSDLMRLFETV